MIKGDSSEKGQALVLLVLAFVVLLGFTARAIDGGMVYADRRHAQNASDASSLSGGSAVAMYLENYYVDYEDFDCYNASQIIADKINNAMAAGRAAAISLAGENDFTIDADISDNNGVATRCGMDDNGGWVDKYVDVTTTITADTRTNFVHLLYNGPLRNTVQAVTRVRPRMPAVFGNAVVALATECPNNTDGGIQFQGVPGPGVTVNGSIFSNACMRCAGNPSITITGEASYITTDEDCDATFNTQQVGTPLPTYSLIIPVPGCANPPANPPDHNGGGTLSPGHYGRIRVTGANEELVLTSGLYCVHEDFTMNGGQVRVDPPPGGGPSGVTIYMVNEGFSIAGNVLVNLMAPPVLPEDACTYCPPAIQGLLIYSAEGNTGGISALGAAGSSFVGTIYAPSGQVDIGGNEDVTVTGQVIGDTVIIHGGPGVLVNYNPEVTYRPPASMELAR